MLYNPPTGSTDPNAPYQGKNLAAGQDGSKIPPAMPEFTQREIVNAITESGQAPTNNDLKQLLKAIRSGQMAVLSDTGTPSAIVATGTTPHTMLLPGMPVCFKLANNIVGATTANLSGIGARQVTHPGGAALQRYDFLANDLLVTRVNTSGTGFVVMTPISQAVIDGPVVKTVHGTNPDFADLNAAFAWLNRRRIAATGSVMFQLAAGVGANKVVYTTGVAFNHSDGVRVTILGAPLGGLLPNAGVLTVSGTGAAARAADTSVNLALLRNVYSTEIMFAGGSGFFGSGTIGNIQDLLITADGTGTSDGILWNNGNVAFTNVSTVGTSARGIALSNAFAVVNGRCFSLGCKQDGYTAATAAVFTLSPGAVMCAFANGGNGFGNGSGVISALAGGNSAIVAKGNAADGVSCISGRVGAAAPSDSSNNGGNGWNTTFTGSASIAGVNASNNGASGFAAGGETYVEASNTTGSGNATYGYFAFNGATLNRPGATAGGVLGGSSPAVGATGNNNAIVI